VTVGDQVKVGDTLATIEAMKMEAAITAPVGGVVRRLAVRGTGPVEGGDLLVVIE
jgi:pyruvate carboxylase